MGCPSSGEWEVGIAAFACVGVGGVGGGGHVHYFKVACVIVPIIHGGSHHLPTMLIINNSSRFRVPQRVCLLGSPHVGMHDGYAAVFRSDGGQYCCSALSSFWGCCRVFLCGMHSVQRCRAHQLGGNLLREERGDAEPPSCFCTFNSHG
jgi:hypothetical protein